MSPLFALALSVFASPLAAFVPLLSVLPPFPISLSALPPSLVLLSALPPLALSPPGPRLPGPDSLGLDLLEVLPALDEDWPDDERP